MNKSLFQKVAARIDSYKGEMVELQRKLVGAKALGPTNGGPGEYEKYEIIEPLLKEIYDEVELIRAKDKRVSCGFRPNAIARTKGKSSDRTIWIMSHLDVVPAGNESAWKTPPFELVVKDGNMYGRGVEDNNQGIVSAIYAAKAFKDEGITPTFNIASLFASDEETGNEHGALYLMKNCKDLFGPNDIAIVPDGGDPKGADIEVAEKGCLWLKIKTTGIQTHGSMPERGVNAHRAAAFLVCRLNDLYKIYPEKDNLFQPPISTFEPTKREANIDNINTIPGEDTLYLDCRTLPNLPIDTVIKTIEECAKEIEERFGVKISHETIFRVDAAPATPKDSPIVTMLQKAVKDVLGVDAHPMGIGGGTFGSLFRKTGLHVAVYGQLIESFHQPNEYYPIEYMLNNTKMWAHVYMQD